MFWRRSSTPAAADVRAAAANRRVAERHSTAILSTDLGTVLDVSRTGLRISCVRKPGLAFGAEHDLELSSAKESITLRAKVVRTRQVSGGRFELGLELLGLDDAQRDALELFAQTGSTRRGATTDPEKRDRLIAALKAPDYYAILGVAREASRDNIQQAFRALARALHPDVNPAPDALERFVLVNEAHKVLSNEQARAEYDRLHQLKAAS